MANVEIAERVGVSRPTVNLWRPTSGSWLNLVECWFAIIERQAIHRGSFGSVPDLNAAIRRFINGWNERSAPFTWIKPADDILSQIKRKKTSHAGH